MISVDISVAIFLYLMTSLAGLLVLWIWFETKETVVAGRPAGKEMVWECAICAYIYIDSTHDTISTCPQCKSLNRKDDA